MMANRYRLEAWHFKVKRTLLAAIFLTIFAPATARADCANPSGTAGVIAYNIDYQTMQFCDGTTWWDMKAANSGLPACADGDTIVYNSGSWICQPLGGAGTFDFTNLTAQPVSTLIASDIVQVTGFTGSLATSITGTGSPQYRTCTDGTSSANCDASVVQNWTSGSATIAENEYLQLHLTTSSSWNTQYGATVSVGTDGDSWSVTTASGPCAVLSQTLVSSTKTVQDCLGAGGGTPVDIGGGSCVCKRVASSCWGGWTAHPNWMTTTVNSCSESCGNCTTGSHAWANTARESCTHAAYNGGQDDCSSSNTCYANITEIACR